MTEQSKIQARAIRAGASRARMTQTTVGAALKRRPDSGFTPSVTRDHEVGGLLLFVGARKATWRLAYKPHGRREDGRRHAKVQMILGDATTTPLLDVRTAARAIKVEVARGRDPHAERRAARAGAVAVRAVKPTTLAEALDTYEKDMLARREPSAATRRQGVHYAKKAIRLMQAGGLAVGLLNEGMIRRQARETEASASEVRHLYGALSRFCDWLVEERVLEANPCASVPRRARPKPGRAREHVPALDELRGVWGAVESEPAVLRDLVRFMLLVPLRRDEAAGLRWAEVDLGGRRIAIGAGRMKNGEAHELPLSGPAREILVRRVGDSIMKPADLVFAGPEAGKAFVGWSRLLDRIRRRIGQGAAPKESRFSLHDARRAFVSLLAARADVDLLDQCLAHKRAGVMRVYQKASRMAERGKIMDMWAMLLLDVEPRSKVVPLRAGVVL